MSLGRLNNGERISAVSAILLYVFMSFDWFGVKTINTSNLLIAFQGSQSGKSAWEALDVISIVLLITIVVTLAVAVLRFADVVHGFPIPVDAVVAILGIVSVLLIIFRIVDPPNFGGEEIPNFGSDLQFEGTVQSPIFLALLAAVGIAFGGCLAMREEGISLGDLRPRRGGALG